MVSSKVISLKAITPVHVGASEGDSIVDLPIQREASTNIPKIDGTILKGSFKRFFIDNSKDEYEKLSYSINHGLLSFSDLRLLLFPIKSSISPYVYITCPLVLKRYKNMIDFFEEKQLGKDISFLDKYGLLGEDEVYCIYPSEKSFVKCEEVYIGDYDFKVINSINIHFKGIDKNIYIMSDENFIDFVKFYTEVVVRIRINGDNNLFTEEYVPAGAIFYGAITHFDDICNDKVEAEELCSKVKERINNIQIAGELNLGKGYMKKISLEVIQ